MAGSGSIRRSDENSRHEPHVVALSASRGLDLAGAWKDVGTYDRNNNTSVPRRGSDELAESDPNPSRKLPSRLGTDETGSVPTQIVEFPGEALERFWPTAGSSIVDDGGGVPESRHNEALMHEILRQIGTLFDAEIADWMLEKAEDMDDEINAMAQRDQKKIGYNSSQSFRLWLSTPQLYEDIVNTVAEDSTIRSRKEINIDLWLMMLLVSDRVQNLLFGTRLYVWLRRRQVETKTLSQLDLSDEAQRHWYDDNLSNFEEEVFRTLPSHRTLFRTTDSMKAPRDSDREVVSKGTVRLDVHDTEQQPVVVGNKAPRRPAPIRADSHPLSRRSQRSVSRVDSATLNREEFSANEVHEIEALRTKLGKIRLFFRRLKITESKVLKKLTNLERQPVTDFKSIAPKSVASKSVASKSAASKSVTSRSVASKSIASRSAASTKGSISRNSLESIEEAPLYRSSRYLRKVSTPKTAATSGPIRCRYLGCERMFTSQAELDNHIAVRTHKFACHQPGCDGRTFPSQAEFLNHYEVLHQEMEEDMAKLSSSSVLRSRAQKMTESRTDHQNRKSKNMVQKDDTNPNFVAWD